MDPGKKLVVGWFTFTCSEDSTILFTELLNTHFDEWKNLVEFRFLKALKTKNSLEGLDVAFIEGAISSDSQAEVAKKIRANARYVVAVGSCACTGMPSASRNTIPENEIDQRITYYLSHFDYSGKVRKLADIIQVDDQVPGCPMNTSTFLEILGKYLKVFNIIPNA